jgi:hypothetical protein
MPGSLPMMIYNRVEWRLKMRRRLSLLSCVAGILGLMVLMMPGFVKAADEVKKEAYWVDAKGVYLNQLNLSIGESRAIRLQADIPAGKTLKAFNITVSYDASRVSVEDVMASVSNMPPMNINMKTPGYITFNGFSTTGVTGPSSNAFIDLTVKAKAAGSSIIDIAPNSYGASETNQFWPSVETLTVMIK